MNIDNWKKKAISALITSHSPYLDVELLLSNVLKKDRSWIIAFGESKLDTFQLRLLNAMLFRRIQGEPIAYIIGKREFWSLSLKINNSTLIPRPDSEVLVEQALNHLPSIPASILDLGTGCGAIALALASERIDCHVKGCDKVPAAIELAKKNANILQIVNVDFKVSYWFDNLSPQLFELIVSNPPYIDENDEHLNKGDLRFEPRTALVAADHGLSDLRKIITMSPLWLHPRGWLLLEHGWKQDRAVRAMMKYHGYHLVKTINDYQGNPRVTLGMCT